MIIPALFPALALVLGAIVGSFLNVVILRFNTGVGVGGRSSCMSCGRRLRWFELVPVLSFLIQGGKCRRCKARLSWQYPLVEAGTGLIFMGLVMRFSPDTYAHAISLAIYLVSSCLLMVIAVYDWRHKIIPDYFAYAFAAVAFLSSFLGGQAIWHAPSPWQLLAGPVMASPFFLIWLVSKGTWMGLGDAKLALGIGWLLGMNGGANALIWSFWIGAVAGIAWMYAVHRRFHRGMEIPFGPFMIIGLYVVLLFGWQAIDLRVLAALF